MFSITHASVINTNNGVEKLLMNNKIKTQTLLRILALRTTKRQ